MPRLIRYPNVHTRKCELAGYWDPHKLQKGLQRNGMMSRVFARPTASISFIQHLSREQAADLLTGSNSRPCVQDPSPASLKACCPQDTSESRSAATNFVVSARYGACSSVRNGMIVKIHDIIDSRFSNPRGEMSTNYRYRR